MKKTNLLEMDSNCLTKIDWIPKTRNNLPKNGDPKLPRLVRQWPGPVMSQILMPKTKNKSRSVNNVESRSSMPGIKVW